MANWLLRADPDRRAVNSLTYGELLERVRRARVPAGARAGIALAPGEDFAVALHACWMRNSIAVPHDLRLRAADRPSVEVTLSERPQSGEPIDPPALDLDAPAVELRTSGTSGEPRLVPISFGNLLWSALGSAAALGTEPEDRWLCALPLSHVGGLSILVRSAVYGTTAIVHDGWDTERVAAEDATLISLVPTMLQRLLDAGWTGSPSLRWALIGGAPLSPALRERALEAGVPLAETYGLTEACSQVTTFGVPLFCTNVSIAADGEIVVSGPTVAGGGELRTGDLGEVAADGTLRVIGRKSDMIITGGENVAPAAVEAVIEAHHGVAEALVGSRPDREWGEAVIATVVAADGRPPTEAELRRFCRDRLAPFEVPKEFVFTSELPRTASGKLIRHR